MSTANSRDQQANNPQDTKGVPIDSGAEEERAAQQAALVERLIIKPGTPEALVPFGGALIKIDSTYYEPSRLTISSFSIRPYDGVLIPGQMFQCFLMLPGEVHPFEIPVSGAVKTVDQDFGLRAIFNSPQPHAQATLAQFLIKLRSLPLPPPESKKKKGWW